MTLKILHIEKFNVRMDIAVLEVWTLTGFEIICSYMVSASCSM